MAESNFLVIGGGVAGLRAAIEASSAGEVLLLNKCAMEESASQKAQGGIAAVLNAEDDELELHYQDTLDAGHGLCSPEAVRILVQEGPKRVHELIEWGARFDKIGSAFAAVLEGVHRKPRVLRAHGDATGLEMVKTLIQRAKQCGNIRLLSNQFAIDLIIEEGECKGAWVMDEAYQVYPLLAQSVILATGGAGQIFARTTNPPLATGDGVAMALRAGAVVEDMEFIQFHPTALSLPDAPAFLLSEAMRGEGARLIHSGGKPFMTTYHPNGDLAPRDIVTRGMVKEITSGQKVFMDLTHLPSDFVRKRFPTIDATCRMFGVDIARDPIPVAPAAHYIMGGIKTDLMGKTSIERLWACGEVAATGVHGANRLASNSLLEGIVFGARAGLAAASVPFKKPVSIKGRNKPGRSAKTAPHPPNDYRAIAQQLKEMMWKEAGIIRSRDSLDRAVNQWHMLESALSLAADDIPQAFLRQYWETRNMLMVSAAIIAAAKTRKESIGAHFREDASGESSAEAFRHISFEWNTLYKVLAP